MTGAVPANVPSGEELAAIVDSWRSYVRGRVHERDVDDILQESRETAITLAGNYDPTRGEPGAFVFGIIRVKVAAARRIQARDSLRRASADAAVPLPSDRAECGDPLTVLIDKENDLEWVRFVADAATTFEWQVLVAFAEAPRISADVAALLGVQPSTVRDARARVAALTRTVRIALCARDEGHPIVLDRCVPSEGGYAAVLPYRHVDPATAAAALGICRAVFSRRRAMVERLALLVHQIRSTTP